MKRKNEEETVIFNICLQTSSLTIFSFFFFDFGQIQFLPKFLLYNSSDEAAKLHLFDALMTLRKDKGIKL